jgi:hypothetical protein
MKRGTYKITINAEKAKVWEVLWSDATYPQWTIVFGEGSRAESDWQEGSPILFVNAKGDGMYSRIKKSDKPNAMIFQHLGMFIDGVEKPFDSDWAGSEESYFLHDVDGKTEVITELDTADDYKSFFDDTFPQGLQIVKRLSEI